MLLEVESQSSSSQTLDAETESRPALGGTTLGKSWYLPCKVVGEFILSFALLVILSPVILLAVALVRLSSPGPGFYSQIRVGKNGRRFRIYKIRTMVEDSESKTGAVWSTANDPRVTQVGRLLRLTHIDEFPQLWNVLRGDMSLVGPRPERPEIVPNLEQRIPNYADRLQVRPGITGLAQIYLPPDSDLDSVRRKLTCDLHYLEHLSAGLDWQILICTGFSCVGVPWWVTRRLLFLPRPDEIETREGRFVSVQISAPQLERPHVVEQPIGPFSTIPSVGDVLSTAP